VNTHPDLFLRGVSDEEKEQSFITTRPEDEPEGTERNEHSVRRHLKTQKLSDFHSEEKSNFSHFKL
jgi:hypothetical protein